MADDEAEAYYFNYSASFRVKNAPRLHEEITARTGLVPTEVHQRGDIRNERTGATWPNDIWILKSPLRRETTLSYHLHWLWEQVSPHSEYFRSLVRQGINVDVFCGYRSNCATCGFRIDALAVEISHELGIPLEVSVIIL